MIKVIESNNTIYAKIIKAGHIALNDGFFTENNDEIQFGFLNRKKDYKTGAHYHNRTRKKTNQTDEILILQKGSARIDFYDDKGVYFKSNNINQGDIIIIYKGGHNITYLEDTSFFIIKPGPHDPETNKTRIVGTNNLDLIFDKD